MDIKEVAKVITEWADKTKWSMNIACTPEEAFAFANLAKIAKEPERKAGELTRKEAMIAYCSGKIIRVISAHDSGYDAWLVGQTPLVQFDNKNPRAGAIPRFVDDDYSFEIALKPLVLVDGLAACKAYREGKTIRRNSQNHKATDCGNHPNFAVDGWEILSK